MLRSLVAVASLGVTAGVVAQSPTPRRLGPPIAELAEPLSSVAGIRELANGRVVLLDNRERTVWITDAAFRTTTKVGREGSGPGEYSRPVALAALPGDTTWIMDGGSRRTLVLAPNGTFSGTAEPVSIRPSEGVTYGITPRGMDAQGRIYSTLPLGLIDRGPSDKGETPVIRYDRRTGRFDTVATFLDPTRLRAGTTATRPVGPAGGVSMGVSTSGQGFAAKDEWAVAPDGAVAVVRADPYRVDWRLPNGTLQPGKPVSYTKVRVGDAEKEQYLDELRARGGGTLTTTGADGRTQTQRLPVNPPASWAEHKPPFVAGTSIAAPNGTLWVLRSGRASEKEATLDVFDRTGTLVDRMVLPARARVVGFGAGHVYIARYDDDDLMHVGRYALP